MSEVVELRVHGVGGSTPEALLGVPSPSDTVLVAGDVEAPFYKRRWRGPTVEAYIWGGLTSGSIAQTFWIFVLPFTLLNVAGWMYPPASRSRWWFARKASRILLALLGVSLTLSYTLWLLALSALLLLDGLRFRSMPAWLGPTQRAIASLLVVAAIGVLVYAVTRSRQERFEAYRRRQPQATPARFVSTLVADQLLEDPSLWAEERVALALLRVHTMIAGLALAGGGAWFLIRVGELGQAPDFHPLLRWSVAVEVSIGLVMLLMHLVFERPSGFRIAAPALIATAGVAIAAGFFSGLWHLVATLVQHEAVQPASDPLGGLGGAFGAGMLASLAGLLAWAIWHGGRVPRQMRAMRAEGVPLNTAPAGWPRNGLSRTMYRRTAWVRAFATGPRHADLILTAGSIAFATAAVATLAGFELFSQVADFGRWALYAIIAAVVPFFIYRSRRPETARRIAIVWDVLTFFPRRFHPFAVRPYAERAVPDLQGRIAYHREAGRPVILCGHSQGSVICLAALAQLIAEPEIVGKVGLVTFGSPLVQLHARFFPELFGAPGLFPRIHSTLAAAAGSTCVGWRNFYRATDYVGQQLFAGSNSAGCDTELPDPPQESHVAQRHDQESLSAAVDATPPAWVRTTVHSHYLGERRLRDWVRQLRNELL